MHSLDREATEREQQTPWTEDEVAALREGVRTFGEGRWEVVLDTYVARFQSGRTADDLEDKWRHTQQEAKGTNEAKGTTRKLWRSTIAELKDARLTHFYTQNTASP